MDVAIHLYTSMYVNLFLITGSFRTHHNDRERFKSIQSSWRLLYHSLQHCSLGAFIGKCKLRQIKYMHA